MHPVTMAVTAGVMDKAQLLLPDLRVVLDWNMQFNADFSEDFAVALVPHPWHPTAAHQACGASALSLRA